MTIINKINYCLSITTLLQCHRQ